MTTSNRGWSSALFLAFLLPGCGPTWPQPHAPYAPTRSEQQWDKSFQLERAGSLDEAASGFSSLCRQSPPYLRGCYDRMRIGFQIDAPDAARQSASEFILRYPDHPLAPSAVDLMLDHADTDDNSTQLLLALTELSSRTAGTDVWDSILYRMARLHARRGNTEEESRALHEIRKLGRWGSQLYDDAMWRLISIAHEKNARAEEVELLREFVATMESSWFIGSYHSRWHDHALARLGDMLTETGDRKEAYRAYRKLARWKSSRLRDRGLLGAAEVQHLRGRHRSACRHLKTLVETLPESRLVNTAASRQLHWNCRIKKNTD